MKIKRLEFGMARTKFGKIAWDWQRPRAGKFICGCYNVSFWIWYCTWLSDECFFKCSDPSCDCFFED